MTDSGATIQAEVIMGTRQALLVVLLASVPAMAQERDPMDFSGDAAAVHWTSTPPDMNARDIEALGYSLAICSTERQIRDSKRYAGVLRQEVASTLRRQIAIEDQQQGRHLLAWSVRKIRASAKRQHIVLVACTNKRLRSLMHCAVNTDIETCPADETSDGQAVQRAQSIMEEVWQPKEEE